MKKKNIVMLLVKFIIIYLLVIISSIAFSALYQYVTEQYKHTPLRYINLSEITLIYDTIRIAIMIVFMCILIKSANSLKITNKSLFYIINGAILIILLFIYNHYYYLLASLMEVGIPASRTLLFFGILQIVTGIVHIKNKVVTL